MVLLVHWTERNADRVRVQFSGAAMTCNRGRNKFPWACLPLRQARFTFFRVYWFIEEFRAGEIMSDIWDMQFVHESTLPSGYQKTRCPLWIIWRWNFDFKSMVPNTWTTWTSMTGPTVVSPRIAAEALDSGFARGSVHSRHLGWDL